MDKVPENLLKKPLEEAKEEQYKNEASLQNSSEKKKTSGDFKIKISWDQIMKNPKPKAKKSQNKEAEMEINKVEIDEVKKKNSKCIDSLPKIRKEEMSNFNRRITRRMSKNIYNATESKPKVTHIKLKNCNEMNLRSNPLSSKKLENIMPKGIDKNMIQEIINHSQTSNIIKKPNTPQLAEEIIKNSDSYLATMIKKTKNTGLDRRVLDSHKEPAKHYKKPINYPQKIIKNDKFEINERLNHYQEHEIQNIEEIMEHPVVNGFITSNIPPNEQEYQIRMEQDKKYRDELLIRKNQKDELKTKPMYYLRRGRKYMTASKYDQNMHGDQILKKRNDEMLMNDSILNQDIHMPNLKLKSEHMKRVKSRSNPPEKINGKYTEVPKKIKVHDQIDLPFQKELSIKSEKLQNEKVRKPNLENDANAELAENLSNFEERNINMNINVDIDVREQVQDHNGESDRQEHSSDPEEQNGLVEQSGFKKGFTQKIDRIFQKSALSSDRDHEGSYHETNRMEYEYPKDNRLKTYLVYKANMSEFLGFEQARESIRSSRVDNRVKALKQKGGIDKNYWLNYYCSLIRKEKNLDYQDIMKGRLNCISFSLREYNNQYNHKIHRGIFNMGKCIYRSIRDDIASYEQSRMRPPAAHHEYYPYYQQGYNNAPPMRYNQYMQNTEATPYNYMYPRAYYNHPPGRGAKERYFPYFGEKSQKRGMPKISSQEMIPNNQQQNNNAHIKNYRDSYREVEEKNDDYFIQEKKPWEVPDEKQSKLDIVRVNNEIGIHESSEPEKKDIIPMEKVESDEEYQEPKSKRKKKKRRSKIKLKKNKLSISLEDDEDENYEEDEDEDYEETKIKYRRKYSRPPKVKEKPKKVVPKPEKSIKPIQNMNFNKSINEGPIQEPVGDDPKAWIEYFGQVNYAQIKPGTRSYNKISSNFAFTLEEVLEFQEKFNDQIFHRESGNMTADMKKLNKLRPFQRYFNPKEKKENFARNYDPNEIDNSLDTKKIRRLGQFRKHIKDNLDLVTSISDIANVLEKNKDENLVWDLINKRDNGVKTFISHLKKKRFN